MSQTDERVREIVREKLANFMKEFLGNFQQVFAEGMRQQFTKMFSDPQFVKTMRAAVPEMKEQTRQIVREELVKAEFPVTKEE